MQQNRKFMELRIDALNHALEGIPEESVRFHVCWGNGEAPHTRDVALKERVLPYLLRVRDEARVPMLYVTVYPVSPRSKMARSLDVGKLAPLQLPPAPPSWAARMNWLKSVVPAGTGTASPTARISSGVPSTRPPSSALPMPTSTPRASPTPRTREELPQDSDEVIKVDTNLTNIFFTAADRNKRFISNLKADDIRVFEDGQQQDIFTFQTNIDLPLSLAILIDCSASEERTLPDEKEAARAFLENVLRPDEPVPSLPRERALEQAPDPDEGAFRVPSPGAT